MALHKPRTRDGWTGGLGVEGVLGGDPDPVQAFVAFPEFGEFGFDVLVADEVVTFEGIPGAVIPLAPPAESGA